MKTPFLYNATVVSVHDGDTVNVVVDRGMYEYAGSPTSPVPIRLYGMNARELAEPGGVEARDNLASILPPGTQLVLSTVKPDKYQPRWVAAVATDDHPDLVAYLVEQQWGAVYFGTGTKPVPPWPRTA